jgi:putative ABC transport system permease protein
MIFLKLIVTNLRRHRIRSLISVAGIAFSVAAMLTVVTILQGAIGMFSSILSNDSEIIVFERDVSDLFFSNVPADAAEQISNWPMVAHANPVLFGIVSSACHPIITCFGVTPTDARVQKATWLQGDRSSFAQHADDVVLGDLTVPMQIHIDENNLSAKTHFVVPYVQWGLKDPSVFILKVAKEVDIDLTLAGGVTP